MSDRGYIANTPDTFGERDQEDRSHENGSEGDMEIEENQWHTLNLVKSYLKDNREEHESSFSSSIINEGEPTDVVEPKRRDHKIHFGDAIEKQYEEEVYHNQEGEEEAEDQPFSQEEEYILTIDDIRDQIKIQKLKIEESLKIVNDQRLSQRKVNRVSFFTKQKYLTVLCRGGNKQTQSINSTAWTGAQGQIAYLVRKSFISFVN